MNNEQLNFLGQLQDIIEQRMNDMPDSSYTARLFKKGINKIVQKVGEEAVELIIEAKDDKTDLLLNETADLLYHIMVLLTAKGLRIEDVVNILRKRHH